MAEHTFLLPVDADRVRQLVGETLDVALARGAREDDAQAILSDIQNTLDLDARALELPWSPFIEFHELHSLRMVVDALILAALVRGAFTHIAKDIPSLLHDIQCVASQVIVSRESGFMAKPERPRERVSEQCLPTPSATPTPRATPARLAHCLDLSDEIIARAFSHLSLPDLLRASRACTVWRRAALHPANAALWTSLAGISPAVFPTLLPRSRRLPVSLVLDFKTFRLPANAYEPALAAAAQAMERVVSLELYVPRAAKALFEHARGSVLAARAPDLKTLRVDCARASRNLGALFAGHAPCLRRAAFQPHLFCAAAAPALTHVAEYDVLEHSPSTPGLVRAVLRACPGLARLRLGAPFADADAKECDALWDMFDAPEHALDALELRCGRALDDDVKETLRVFGHAGTPRVRLERPSQRVVQYVLDGLAAIVRATWVGERSFTVVSSTGRVREFVHVDRDAAEKLSSMVGRASGL